VAEFDLITSTGLREESKYELSSEMVNRIPLMLHNPRTKNEDPLHVPLNDQALDPLHRVFELRDEKCPISESSRMGELLNKHQDSSGYLLGVD